MVFAFHSPARALAAGLPRHNHVCITTTTGTRTHSMKCLVNWIPLRVANVVRRAPLGGPKCSLQWQGHECNFLRVETYDWAQNKAMHCVASNNIDLSYMCSKLSSFNITPPRPGLFLSVLSKFLERGEFFNNFLSWVLQESLMCVMGLLQLLGSSGHVQAFFLLDSRLLTRTISLQELQGIDSIKERWWWSLMRPNLILRLSPNLAKSGLCPNLATQVRTHQGSPLSLLFLFFFGGWWIPNLINTGTKWVVCTQLAS